MKQKPIKNKVYEIRYIGAFEWNHFEGVGKFTGCAKEIDDEQCYEFEVSDNGKLCTAFFPLSSVFPTNV